MPGQAPLRTIKRWKRYEARAKWKEVPKFTRGLYVLYCKRDTQHFEVKYIGVASVGRLGGGGIKRRLRRHNSKIRGWTHFSFFEVHENILRDEILELEALLLGIFQDDTRIQLSNKQKGSRKLNRLRRRVNWKLA